MTDVGTVVDVLRTQLLKHRADLRKAVETSPASWRDGFDAGLDAVDRYLAEVHRLNAEAKP